MVAGHAMMKLDTRFKDMKHYEQIQQKIKHMTDHPFIEGVTAMAKQISFREPMNPHDQTFALMNKLEELGKKLDVPVTWKATGGVSDGNGISALGIPVLDGCGPVGGHSHNENEYIETDSILSRMKLLYELILAL